MPFHLNKLKKMERSLREMRIRGVKTNIPFLINVMRNDKFRSGDYTTKFIEETPNFSILHRRWTEVPRL